ncbi:MAG: Uma2 family endonuclease [Oscillatoriales cyanobacterium C42_A2020_001]|nr:Uma2 family endonuclease [Leptolyngbyaceae cyanobacterium C42_A2020_001]
MSVVSTKRFTLDEYHRLIELGFLTKRDRVELIRGELVQMVAKGTPHSVCNTALLYELLPVLAGRALVRNQEPVILPLDSEPEPDFAIVRLRADSYLNSHPYPEDIHLLIEVSDSTLSYDQTTKLAVYAENNIQHYWIVNLIAHQLERYSQPFRNESGESGYRIRQIALRNETVAIPGFEDVSLNLASIFLA